MSGCAHGRQKRHRTEHSVSGTKSRPDERQIHFLYLNHPSRAVWILQIQPEQPLPVHKRPKTGAGYLASRMAGRLAHTFGLELAAPSHSSWQSFGDVRFAFRSQNHSKPQYAFGLNEKRGTRNAKRFLISCAWPGGLPCASVAAPRLSG